MKHSDFDILSDINDNLIDELEDFDCPYNEKTEKKIIAKTEKKLKENMNTIDSEIDDTVSGVKIYKSQKWNYDFKIAVLLIIIIGSVSGNVLLAQKIFGGKSDNTISSTVSRSYSCRELVNTAVQSVIQSSGHFDDYYVIDMSYPLWESEFSYIYQCSSPSSLKDFYFLHSDNQTRDDEIAIFRFSDTKSAGDFISILKPRKKSRIEDIKNIPSYDSQTIENLKNAVIIQDDVYVFYFACDNPDAALQACINKINE